MAKKWKWTGTPTKAARAGHVRIVALAALKEIGNNGALDAKRPFGNSGIGGDVAEMIGLVPPVTGDAGWEWWNGADGDAALDYCHDLYDGWAKYAAAALKSA